MATYEEVMGALRNAHDAGDEEAAQRLAQMAQSLKGTSLSAPTKNILSGNDAFTSGTKGTLAALGDIAAGFIKIPAQATLAIGGKIADPKQSLQTSWESAGQAMEDTFPSFGKGMEGNLGYEVPMKPFELYGQAAQKVANAASFGNKDIEGAVNIGANFLPIPFAGKAGRGVAKAIETLDPGLRNIKAPETKPVTSLEKIKAERAAKTPAPEVEPLKDTRSGMQLSKEAYQAALREQELAKNSAFSPEAEAQRALEQEQGLKNMQDLQGSLGEFDSQVKQQRAQDAVDQRNAELGKTPAEVADTKHAYETRVEQERLAKLREQEQVKLSEDSTPSAEHQAWATEQLTKAKDSLDSFQRQVDEARQQARTEQERASVEEAQRVLDERQTALEFEVKKQGTLDFNAQERARQEAAGQEFQNPWLRNLGDKMAKQEALVKRLQADVQSGKKMGTQLVRAQKDLKTMQGHYEKAKANLGKVGDKSTNPFGKDTIELNSGVPLPDSIKNLFSSDKDKKPGSTLHELIPAMSRSLDTPEKVIDALKDQTDIPERGTTRKLQEATQKGLLYAKEKDNHALLNFTYNEFAKAGDNIANLKKELVDTTLLPGLRELSDKEFVSLHQAMLDGMKEKMVFSPEELQTHYGFTEKQVKLYEDFQNSYKVGLDKINEARKAQGKSDISPYIGYMAGMAKGAYKRLVSIEMRKPNGELVTDEKGNPVMTVVGIIGSDWRHITDKRMEALKKEHPEYTFSEEKYSGPGQYGKREMSSLVEALGILSENNPSVEAFAKQMQDIMSSEAESYRGAKKHTMAKKGIWGMEGDKTWATPEQNALDGMKGQIEYLNKIIEWSEYSKAAEQVGKVLQNPDVQLKHKNAAERSTEYLQNVLGTDPQKGLDIVISNVAKSLGIPPNFLEKGASSLKHTFNTAFLSLSPAFLIVNNVSGATAFPAMAQYLASKGIKLNMDGGTGLSHMAEGTLAAAEAYQGKFKSEFDKRAWQAANDLAVTNSQLIGHSSELRKGPMYKANQVLRFGAAASEAAPRASVFMGVARMLKDSGFENDPNIFHVARDVTDMAMGVFRQEEQPTMYNAFGPLAPLASQLSTFATNANSNLMMLGRIVARDKNAKPLLAAYLSAFAMAGLMGVPGYTQLDWLYEQLSSMANKPTTLTNELLKATRDVKGGDALSIGIPALTGIDMHMSLGKPNLLPPMFTGASAAIKAGTDVVNATKSLASGDLTGAGMDVGRAGLHLSPPLIRKNLELELFGDKKPNGNTLMHSAVKGKGTQGTMELTPGEVAARRMGFNMVSSFKKSQEDYQRNLIDQHLQDKQQKIMTSLDESLTSSKGKVNPEKVRDYLDKYIEAEGDPKTFVTQLNSKVLADNTTNIQRYLMQKANSGSLSAVRALKRWKENQIVDRP